MNDQDDAGARLFCSCRGVTVTSVAEPWLYEGPCFDAATDAKHDSPIAMSDAKPAARDASTDGPPPEQIVVGDSGWKWNVACPASVADFCAGSGLGNEPICVDSWGQASKPMSWCSIGASGVTLYGYCNGYYVVGVEGADPRDRFSDLQYFYDFDTGALVHVDSNAIPSFTKCVAGESGSVFSLFGCNYGIVKCP
jgi:hypothetical protein